MWTLDKDNAKSTISHNDVISCFDVSCDSQHVITGSNDGSLKVWTIAEGRLTQVSSWRQILILHCQAPWCPVSVQRRGRLALLEGPEFS